MEKIASLANADSADPFDWRHCPHRVDACRPAMVFGSCFQAVHAGDVLGSSALSEPLADLAQRQGVQDTEERSLKP